jgi:hypothetical protein
MVRIRCRMAAVRHHGRVTEDTGVAEITHGITVELKAQGAEQGQYR